MKKAGVLLAYAVATFIILMAVLPKTELYYAFEKTIEQQGAIIDSEEVSEKWFGLALNDGVLYVKGVQIAKAEYASLVTYLFSTTVKAEGIVLDDLAAKVLPPEITRLQVNYSVLHPRSIKLVAEGAFGIARGRYDPFDKHLELLIEPSKQMQRDYRSTMQKLNKSEEGYRYAVSF